jgi:hypothetical protein
VSSSNFEATATGVPQLKRCPGCEKRGAKTDKSRFELVRTEPVFFCDRRALMAATRAQKHSAAQSGNPLYHSGILQHVLSYVGPGHWFFLAAVNAFWRGLYSKVTSRQMQSYLHITDFTCVPKMTLSSAIFESSARVKLAHKNGADFSTEGFQLAAGRHGTATSLATARELGLEFTHSTMLAAAICNTLPVLQFLHAQGCPWGIRISAAAARRGALDMLHWLHA